MTEKQKQAIYIMVPTDESTRKRGLFKVGKVSKAQNPKDPGGKNLTRQVNPMNRISQCNNGKIPKTFGDNINDLVWDWRMHSYFEFDYDAKKIEDCFRSKVKELSSLEQIVSAGGKDYYKGDINCALNIIEELIRNEVHTIVMHTTVTYTCREFT